MHVFLGIKSMHTAECKMRCENFNYALVIKFGVGFGLIVLATALHFKHSNPFLITFGSFYVGSTIFRHIVGNRCWQ